MFADTLILRWSRSRRRRSWCGQPRVHALPAQPAVPDARALRAQRARRRPRGLCRTRSVQRWDPWAPAAMRGADREEPGAERRGGTRATRSRPGALAAVQSSGSSLPDLSAVASPSRFREAQTREGWSPSRRENGSIRPSLPRPCRSLAARSSAARAHPSVRRALECGHTRRGLTVRPCGAETQSALRPPRARRAVCRGTGAAGMAACVPAPRRWLCIERPRNTQGALGSEIIFHATDARACRHLHWRVSSTHIRDVLMRKLSRPTTPGRPGHKLRYSEANPTVIAAPCECAFQRKARDACKERRKR